MIRMERSVNAIVCNPDFQSLLDSNFLVAYNGEPVNSWSRYEREVAGSRCQGSDALVLPQLAALGPFPGVMTSKNTSEFANPCRVLNQDIG